MSIWSDLSQAEENENHSFFMLTEKNDSYCQFSNSEVSFNVI